MITSMITTFSTVIGISEIDINDSFISTIKNLEYRRVENNNGYISTELNLLSNAELIDIKKEILDTAKEYLINILRVSDSYKLVITTSWANKHSPNDFSQEHDHSNAILTGILFVDVNEFSGKSIFLNPQQNLGLSLELNYQDFNQFNVNKIEMNPKNGDLLLFPASLKHSVSKNLSDQDRYTIAFNIFVSGIYGSHERTLLL
jgi:uncharacterized protein (TIGR02466 family)